MQSLSNCPSTAEVPANWGVRRVHGWLWVVRGRDRVSFKAVPQIKLVSVCTASDCCRNNPAANYCSLKPGRVKKIIILTKSNLSLSVVWLLPFVPGFAGGSGHPSHFPHACRN